jgi:hypothetical protein
MAGSCEYRNKTLSFLRGGEILRQLSKPSDFKETDHSVTELM